MEEAGELAVGGEGGLDGDDDVGRKVGDAGDCMSRSVLRSWPSHGVALPLPAATGLVFLGTAMAGHRCHLPASPGVKMDEAMLPPENAIQLQHKRQRLLSHVSPEEE